ncbi:DUF5320 domain-containing protein [Candidatus Aerophobetes bacterium]|nr:DUF5320 domain-containing protein [Candidatus Aerophobetes bacterium]
MPGGDRTGPLGLGPRTGRGFGYCAGFGAPGFFRYRGRGGGFGRGFGWRWAGGFYPPYNTPYYPPSIADERTYLEEEIKVLREQTASLEKRLGELKKSEEK